MCLVYIAVLNYNTYNKSKVCIDSCLKQIGDNYRIVLIDNCSTDDSFQLLKRDYNNLIDFYETGSNYGFAKGNNLAVKYCLAKGAQYTLLLNSDTELVGDSLIQDLLKVANDVEGCAVVSPTIYDVTQKGNIMHTNDSAYLHYLRLIGILPHKHIINDNLEIVSEAHGSALLVNNSIFVSVGGFPEHYFMYTEECTFSKRIIWAGYLICWIKEHSNIVLHHHDKSKQTDGWRFYLMGRNRSLEYYENRAGKTHLWWIVYQVFKYKMLLQGLKDGNMFYYKGMVNGEFLYKNGISPSECYELGKKVMHDIK